MGGHQLFLCLGGNLGNKSEIFAETFTFIEKRIGRPVKTSAIYASPAWGFHSEDEFWNQVIQVDTGISPYAVLNEIRIIENYFGRERKAGGYRSRKMDIDILFYDNLVLESQELIIPHPMISLRNFVLVPLAEIAPGLIHPVMVKTAREMLSDCSDISVVSQVENCR